MEPSKTTGDSTTSAPPPPRRGKFFAAPPPAPAAAGAASTTTVPKSRGKFLGQSHPSASESSSPFVNNKANSNIDGNNSSNLSTTIRDETNSLSILKTQIHQAKQIAAARRRAILSSYSSQPQSSSSSSSDQVFHDLEEAENIVLALLQCASEVSLALSKLTSAKSKHQHQTDDDGYDSEASKKKQSSLSFEELSTQIRSSGVGYLAGVTKLHSLLAPHASLVKAYRNHHHQQSEVATITAANIGSNTNINDIVKMVTSNMLAARLEKRLAIERREILREMIRLEEMERDDGGRADDNNHVVEDSKSNKRKRIE